LTQERTRLSRLTRLLISFVSLQGATQLVSGVAGILAVRLLPVPAFAVYAIALSVQTSITALSDVGVTTVVLARAGQNHSDLNRLATLATTARRFRLRLTIPALLLGAPLLFFSLGSARPDLLSCIAIFGMLGLIVVLQLSATIDGALLLAQLRSNAQLSAQLVAAIASTLVMVWAVVIAWRYDWATLTTRSRGRPRSVRATRAERARAFPGDELIPDAIATLTHGVTIRRAARDVWPWLLQMGAGTRAGWYSYDWLDNGRQPSATRIVPELQHPAVGTIFPALPRVTEGFTALAIELERVLILGWPAADGTPEVTWTFLLDGVSPGVTRLLVRVRGGPGYRFHGLPLLLTRLVVRVVHFVMQRKQLLGIVRRAETIDLHLSGYKAREGEAA